MFHVGQLVVCVDDDEDAYVNPTHRYYDGLSGLKKGVVYTIRWVGMPRHTRYLCVRIEEIIRPVDFEDGEETPYAAARFRPVVETSLDVFREMLAPVPGVKQKECV